ncbi:cell division control 6 [Striga asiatica]|uniref:Cell division control protein n=1 Tax=Striga asiatica TaxID=4170 RepID=A0A5A7Q4Q3_STRAF|nr:cell division control 6 [Striga asiatica]
MPTFIGRRSSQSSDPAAETGSTAATPRKSRLRSNSDDSIGSPARKSPRQCCKGSPKSQLNVNDFLRSSWKNHLGTQEASANLYRMRYVEQLRAVKEALHLSTAPNTVICREDEHNRILDFCKKCIKEEKAGSLYMCGCPGTGKSLSMEKVKDILLNWANECFPSPGKQDGVQTPDIVSINCTSLTNPSEIFSKIIGQNRVKKKDNRATLSLQLLHNLYSQEQTPGSKMILIIADELDYLITRDRAVLHDLFMLTTMPFSKCIVLGIANAIDLADRFIPKLQSLNCKPTVITFRAYSKDQIISILKERLRALPYAVFQPQALELCARKVAAASGDMRKALSVCSTVHASFRNGLPYQENPTCCFRSAIEILEAETREANNDCIPSSLDSVRDQQPAANATLIDQVNNVVRIDHVAAALSKTFSSPVVDTIQSLPQHQQMILCSAVKLFRKGKKDTTISELNKSYVDVCKSTLIPPVSISELSSMCRVLDDQGILKLGQSRDGKITRVSLKVDGADIVFALQAIRFFRNCLQ